MKEIKTYLHRIQCLLFVVCSLSFFQLLSLFKQPNDVIYTKDERSRDTAIHRVAILPQKPKIHEEDKP